MAPIASTAATQEAEMVECVHQVGYINDEMKHVLLSISNPTLCNLSPKAEFVQIMLTIDNAYILLAELDTFLKQHGVKVH